jgi:hypothetical protein
MNRSYPNPSVDRPALFSKRSLTFPLRVGKVIKRILTVTEAVGILVRKWIQREKQRG